MAYAISPNYVDIDFPLNMSLDQEIEVFSDRVNGWQLDIAQLCADSSPHSGFAVLHILVSYFEMIAKYQDGFNKDGLSQQYFSKGFENVFPTFFGTPNEIKQRILKKLYNDVRCGLYHSGITGRNIVLSGDFGFPIAFQTPPDTVQINPHKLVPALKLHFQSYVRKLRDPKNVDLRSNFEIVFENHLNKP